MKIVVGGKGGVGKTTFSGTLANILAQEGKTVLAVDSDPSMNLHTSVGLENPTPIVELKDLIKERTVLEGGAFRLNPRVDDIPQDYASKKENLSLIVMGTIERGGSGCICPESAFLKALLRHLVMKKDDYLVLDTEAGVEHLGRSIAAKFDLMFVVVEPSEKAVDTAKRIYDMSKEIGIKNIIGIGNKVSNDKQKDFIEGSLPFKVQGYIPYDEAVIEADMTRTPLYMKKNSPALKRIKEITHSFIK